MAAALAVLLVGSGTLAAGQVACSAVVSMSQGRQVYEAQPGLEVLVGGEWMWVGVGGNGLVRWTDPTLWERLRVQHRCAADEGIGRIVFIYDPSDTPGSQMTVVLDEVKAIVAARYPNAAFVPTLLVGGDNHVVCPSIGGGTVSASETHAARISDALAYPGAGPDLDIPCSGYVDGKGHLTEVGATDAQQDLATFFIEG